MYELALSSSFVHLDIYDPFFVIPLASCSEAWVYISRNNQSVITRIKSTTG